MPVSKIKNLILLILGMSVACLLLLVVPTRLHQTQSEQELHAQLEALYASYDIELDRSILPNSIRLYAVELGGQSADSAAAYPRLYGSPSTGCDRSQQSRDLCAQCSECQSCEQRERDTVFCTDLGVQLDRYQNDNVT